jgi:hypothetical protein
MSELIPGTKNQSRMEAAQEAMREVIDGIPERDGLNVGFRIYGHEGSNDEADRPVSCHPSQRPRSPLYGVAERAKSHRRCSRRPVAPDAKAR